MKVYIFNINKYLLWEFKQFGKKISSYMWKSYWQFGYSWVRQCNGKVCNLNEDYSLTIDDGEGEFIIHRDWCIIKEV